MYGESFEHRAMSKVGCCSPLYTVQALRLVGGIAYAGKRISFGIGYT